MPKDVLELLAESSEGVYAVDLSQKIVLWNHSAERILGWKADETLGKLCYQVIAGTYVETRSIEMKACANNCFAVQWARHARVAPSHRVLTHTKSGVPKWINITHILLPSDLPELGTLAHVFQDVTEDVAARETVVRLTELLNSSSATKRHESILPTQRLETMDGLTSREKEVLRLLAQGIGSDSIAQELSITKTTVRNHIQRILAKFRVHTRLEAVVYASRAGLI